jgi:hypothetical protein
MKRMAMKYIEILIAAGDDLFRQSTMETIPLAMQRYIEALQVFGPPVNKIPSMGKRKTKTFNELMAGIDDFSNAATDMELMFPFSAPAGGSNNPQQGSLGFLRTGYFCIPVNPRIKQLRMTIEDRLHKIRGGQDINGVARRLPLWDPPIDPAVLVQAVANKLSPASVLSEIEGPLPNYRFAFLLQKALELCNELKTLTSNYLTAREKKDGEALSIVKAQQEDKIQNIAIEVKDAQRQEAISALAQLQESRRSATVRLQFFASLTGDDVEIPNCDQDFREIQQVIPPTTKDAFRMNVFEVEEMEKAKEASVLNACASGAEILASTFAMIPSVSTQAAPFGVGVTINSPPWGQRFLVEAGIFRQVAQLANDNGQHASRSGRMLQQLQDRRLQANLAGREIKSIDKQIDAQKARVLAAEKDIALQRQTIADSKDTLEFLRTKYTNTQLYAWMDGAVRDSLNQTYTLAMDYARRAQRALAFERGLMEMTIISPSGYWDGEHDGLTCGDSLSMALRKLELAYAEQRGHDFELTKNISLRQIQPMELQKLRENGLAEFSFPEALFDFDFPGHFNRRIKSIGVSVPCIIGPYTSINCTLSLRKHRYRISPDITDGYKVKERDERFHQDDVPIKSIAITSVQNDSGVFELNFHEERFMPFEGAGAISDWTLSLPHKIRQFDYRTISDVIFHVRYTAQDGGADFATAAEEALVSSLASLTETPLYGLLDLQSDFSSEWYGVKSASGVKRSLVLHNLKDRLPFFTKTSTVTIQEVKLFCSTTGDNGIVEVQVGEEKLDANQKMVGSLKVFAANLNKIPDDWTVDLVATDEAAFARIERLYLMYQYTIAE